MGEAEKKVTYDFKKFYNTVSGSPRESKTFHNGVNPSDKSSLWNVPLASEDDLNESVKSAQAAFKVWSRKSWEERQSFLGLMRDELKAHREEMGNIIQLECGKPAQFAIFEVDASVNILDWHTKQPPPAEEIIQDDADLKLTHRYVPLGVVAAICPWNFPLILAINKIATGLLTGNTVIVKPSPFTPYSILKFIEMVQKFLPPGVLQGLNGDEKFGPLMTEHPGIAKISFTGSIATGKRVMMSAAKTLKRVTLELGGNSACVICPDVDVSKIAPQIALGAFYNSGQLCVASKRIYVHKDIYEEMKEALVKVIQGWKTGPTTLEGVMLGPVQNEMQYNIVKGFFEDCAVNGYTFALGGGEVKGQEGFVIQPAIIDNPPDHSRIVKEEPFGPIVPLLVWDDETTLLSRVNDTNTGLGGAVWSADLDRADRIGRQIEAGSVWINGFERPLAQAYMAGHKESGIGGEQGKHGLLAYMNAQVLHLYKADIGKARL